MTNPTPMQRENGQYLWFSLLGLGFQPDAAASSVSKTNMKKYLNLGPNMFDKPNKDAFYIVTHFLLEKLNPARFHETYRHCWPLLNHKSDAEFRKLTCSWLREIMDDSANAGSKVVASLFLSPGGPKFISLMLHLASYVMLQEMKTFNTNGSWVPEAAATPASSSDVAAKRFGLVRSRFLKAAVDQDRFLREYQRRAQGLVKSMRDLKAESAKYDELLKRFSPDSAEVEPSLSEKIQKVRSLWSDVEAMLSTIREERSAMEAVLKGNVEQNVLDGTDRALTIPRCLQERIEQLPHQLNSGSVYEAGQLNLACVLELSNHALQLLKEQRTRVSAAPESRPSPEDLQEKSRHLSRVLQELHLIRQKLSKEEIPEMRRSIRELEADWDKRWSETLKETPLVSFLKEDPALEFLSPMAPLSFEPAAAEASCVFSQFPAKLPEEKPAERESEEVLNTSSLNTKSVLTAAEAPEGAAVTAAKVPQVPVNTSLDWLFDTPPSPHRKALPPSPFQASVRKTTHQKIAPLKPKAQILDLEYENLADQFADAVMTASPAEGRAEGVDLENLLTTLQRDPFSARKQLPRTPESLILEVKSSWRKAVKEDEATKLSPPDELNISLTEPLDVSPACPSWTTSCTDSTSVHQRGVVQESSFLWDTFQTEVLDSPSGTGSSAVQFSLDLETLPELPSCDSLSLEDEAVEMISEEDEEGGTPVLNFKVPPVTTPCQVQNQRTSGRGSLTERTTESLLLDYRDKDWLTELGEPEKPHKVFSLDLDLLDAPSPEPKPEYSLPKLIPISPVDDMKC